MRFKQLEVYFALSSNFLSLETCNENLARRGLRGHYSEAYPNQSGARQGQGTFRPVEEERGNEQAY